LFYSTASNRDISPSVKTRVKFNPVVVPCVSVVPASTDLTRSTRFTDAILFLQALCTRLRGGNSSIFLLCGCRGHARSTSIKFLRFVVPWKPPGFAMISQHEKAAPSLASANENDLPSAVD